MSTLAPCGTYSAFQRHRRRNEPIDAACKAACAEYQRAYRASTPAAREKDRFLNGTRSRALERLGREYPLRFAELLAEERRAW